MEDRLSELRNKETLTTNELDDLIALSPVGTFLMLPNMKQLGVINAERALRHFREGPTRSKHALEHGCYIEVLSLRLQHAEFWLRMYWTAKNEKGQIFAINDRRTFGTITADCASLGFPKHLIERLQDFNTKRVAAIHKYLLGGIDYDDLRETCEEHFGLDREIYEYVISAVGIPARKAEDLVGNICIRRDLKQNG